ncbi:pseudouridine synthase [Sediminibacterium sp.]|uniref:pseudouridine synthase n=1 Tax=Sediminibacterium sp. TaxID=1917865 RepID=UPI003F69ECF7
MKHHYYILNKPCNMVSQFKSSHAVPLLGNLHFNFPEGTHAIGRLDQHSEGLLLLTTNKKVTRLLFQGATPHLREYHVLVNSRVSQNQLDLLSNGVPIRTGNEVFYTTRPCMVSLVDPPIIQFNSDYIPSERVPHNWISIGLTEGKFHQVRKMLGSVGLKCKRLVRVRIENLQLGNLEPGCIQELTEKEFFTGLKISDY